MSTRTRFLGRLIGLYCIVISLAMGMRRAETLDAIRDILRSPATLLTLGVVTLFAGLATVLAHNVWSGGAPTVLVTIVGWVALAKSLMLLCFYPEHGEQILQTIHYDQIFPAVIALNGVLGVYLTYACFRRGSPT